MLQSGDKRTLKQAFLRYAVPGVCALLLNSIYIVVDGLFVARLIGREALAAVTVGVPVVEILIALSMLVSVGAGALISRHRGRSDMPAAREAFCHSFFLLLGFSLLVAGCGLLLHEQIGYLMGGTQDIMPLVKEYFVYIFAFSPFLMFSCALGAWARNDERPTLALVAMAAGTVTNIALDYVFIALFHWGVGGAALATGLGPLVSCAIMLPHFLKKKGGLYFERTRVQAKLIRSILKEGVPAFLMEFALGLTTLCMNIAVSFHMGALGLAAYGVVGYVSLLLLTIFLGMAEGLQPLYSFHHGKKEPEHIRYLLRLALVSCTAFGMVAYALLLAFAKAPAAIFAGQDAALLALSVAAIHLYFPALFASGINIQAACCLQAVGSFMRSALVSASRSLVLLAALLLVLPSILGNSGVWLSAPIAELLTLPLSLLLLRACRRESSAKVQLHVPKANPAALAKKFRY